MKKKSHSLEILKIQTPQEFIKENPEVQNFIAKQRWSNYRQEILNKWKIITRFVYFFFSKNYFTIKISQILL